MHDLVSLEAKGLPTAAIVTDQFLEEAWAQLKVLAMDQLYPAVITHPLSTLTDAQIAQRAAEAVPQVRKIWLTGTPEREPASDAEAER